MMVVIHIRSYEDIYSWFPWSASVCAERIGRIINQSYLMQLTDFFRNVMSTSTGCLFVDAVIHVWYWGHLVALGSEFLLEARQWHLHSDWLLDTLQCVSHNVSAYLYLFLTCSFLLCLQAEHPVYWSVKEWCDGFRKLLDYLGLLKVHIFGASLGKNIFAFVYEYV
jgi:hypothetical protein